MINSNGTDKLIQFLDPLTLEDAKKMVDFDSNLTMIPVFFRDKNQDKFAWNCIVYTDDKNPKALVTIRGDRIFRQLHSLRAVISTHDKLDTTKSLRPILFTVTFQDFYSKYENWDLQTILSVR